MAFVNFATREITAKIVYYGPGLGGKTTSLQFIHGNLAPENRGKMISLATEEDRTIYFDFLPLNLGKIQDFAVRVQLYTVPGQVRYNATRKLVLRGADGLVFVSDSQKHKKLADLESYNNMEENLRELGKDLRDLPHVLQFNKVDLPGVMTSEELNQILNKHNVPFYETVATTGIGVLDALKSITKLVFNDLSKKALLQRKTRTTTGAPTAAGTEYSLGTNFAGAQAAAAPAPPVAVKTAPAPPPPPPVPEPEPEPVSASYYGDNYDHPEEIVQDDLVDKMEDTFTPGGAYTELELEGEPDTFRETDTGMVADVEPIEEVEPLAEFDDEPSVESLGLEPLLADDVDVGPAFDVPEEEAVFTVEEPLISVPIVPVDSGTEALSVEPVPIEPVQAPDISVPALPVATAESIQEPVAEPVPVPVPAPASLPASEPVTPMPSPAPSGLSYGDMFDDFPEFAGIMQTMEKQISQEDGVAALGTARTAYDYLLQRMFPETLSLDGSEASRILVLDISFKRYAKFKSLLWADPSRRTLLQVHHFLCELYLRVKEL